MCFSSLRQGPTEIATTKFSEGGAGGSWYLDEANILGVDAEALTAGVDAVLPDHSVPVSTHPAARQFPRTGMRLHKCTFRSSRRNTSNNGVSFERKQREKQNLPGAGTWAVFLGVGVPHCRVTHLCRLENLTASNLCSHAAEDAKAKEFERR